MIFRKTFSIATNEKGRLYNKTAVSIQQSVIPVSSVCFLQDRIPAYSPAVFPGHPFKLRTIHFIGDPGTSHKMLSDRDDESFYDNAE